MNQSLPAGPQLVNVSDARWFSSSSSVITLPTGVNGTDELLHLATANEVRETVQPVWKYSITVNIN
jgi:hypothetical protein